MLSLVIAYRPLFAPSLALRVMERLGGRSPVSPIETFIESLPAASQRPFGGQV